MPSKKQQLLNEALQKKIEERGIVFSPVAKAAMEAYEAWEKFDALFPTVGRIKQIVSLGSVGLQSGATHGVGPYESDESLRGIPMSRVLSYLSLHTREFDADGPVLLNQLRAFVLSLHAASMDDATWKETLARSVSLAVLTQKEADWLGGEVSKLGSVAACYRRFHVDIYRAQATREAKTIGAYYARLACLEAAISSLRIEHPKNLSDVMVQVFRERGVDLPESIVKREKEMIFSVGSSLNIHHAAFEVLLDSKRSKKGAVVLVPEGSFEQNIIDPEFFGGKVCMVPTDASSGFKLTGKAMEAVLSKLPNGAAACLMLISPTNPLGLIYTADELRAIGAVATKYDLKIICDEHFAGLHHDPKAKPVSLASLSVRVLGKTHRLYDRTLTIQGMSKLFDDEYRKGGIACSGDVAWVSAIKKILARDAAEPSLDDVMHSELVAQQSDLTANRVYLANQLKMLKKALAHANKIAGKKVYDLLIEPECGFFTVLTIPAALGRKVGIENHHDFCQYVLMRAPMYGRSIQGMAFRVEDTFCMRINFGDAIEKHMFQAFTGLGHMAKEMLKGTAPSIASLREQFEPKPASPPKAKKGDKGKKQKKKK